MNRLHFTPPDSILRVDRDAARGTLSLVLRGEG